MVRELISQEGKIAPADCKAAAAVATGMGVVIDRVAKTFAVPTAATAANIYVAHKERWVRILTELQQMMGLPTLPKWIDCFDNSNIQGENAVAGCVVYRMGKASKSDYKRFEIKTVEGPDDYASMREVVRRRYQHLIDEGGQMPDLIIADGGLGQMHAIREAVEDQLGLNIPIAGLKKNDKHRTQTLLYGFPPKEISMPVTSEVFRLLTNIQDEVHRFAISFHKAKRSKAQIHSQLDDFSPSVPVGFTGFVSASAT